MPSSSTLALMFAVLVAATVTDIRTNKVPNGISLGGCVLGLACGAALAGWAGLLNSGAGLLTGFAALLPLYALKGMGAGDVKLMAATGSFLGPAFTLDAVLYTFLGGGVLALIAVVHAVGPTEWVRQLPGSVKHLLLRRVWVGGPRPAGTTVRKLRFPYALAIGLGAALAVYGPPLLRLRF